MKKIILIIICFFAFQCNIKANEKIEVTFSKCVDGVTANFIMNDKEVKVRFLAIDTPESVSTKVEPEKYGKEASNFTCDKISNANKIELEFDKNSDEKDKYDRYLAWIWVDDYLLQDLIIKEGYAEVAYLYGDYKYTSLLQDHESIAKASKLNIWEDDNKDDDNNIYIYIIIGGILIISCFFSKKIRNKTIKKLKNSIKKAIG